MRKKLIDLIEGLRGVDSECMADAILDKFSIIKEKGWLKNHFMNGTNMMEIEVSVIYEGRNWYKKMYAGPVGEENDFGIKMFMGSLTETICSTLQIKGYEKIRRLGESREESEKRISEYLRGMALEAARARGASRILEINKKLYFKANWEVNEDALKHCINGGATSNNHPDIVIFVNPYADEDCWKYIKVEKTEEKK